MRRKEKKQVNKNANSPSSRPIQSSIFRSARAQSSSFHRRWNVFFYKFSSFSLLVFFSLFFSSRDCTEFLFALPSYSPAFTQFYRVSRPFAWCRTRCAEFYRVSTCFTELSSSVYLVLPSFSCQTRCSDFYRVLLESLPSFTEFLEPQSRPRRGVPCLHPLYRVFLERLPSFTEFLSLFTTERPKCSGFLPSYSLGFTYFFFFGYDFRNDFALDRWHPESFFQQLIASF